MYLFPGFFILDRIRSVSLKIESSVFKEMFYIMSK